jgi:hypothetical protein
MIMAFKIKKVGTIPGVLSRRDLQGLMKSMWAFGGEYWHKNFRAKHFTPAGGKEYGYRPRAKKYMIQKAKTLHHQRPLVRTGESEKATRMRDVRATSKGVRVVMVAPKLNFSKGNGMTPRQELTKISAKERDQMVKLMEARLDKSLAAFTASKSENIK